MSPGPRLHAEHCQWCGRGILWVPGYRRPVDAESVPYEGQQDGLIYSRRHHAFRYAADVYPPPAACNMTHYCAEGLHAWRARKLDEAIDAMQPPTLDEVLASRD